MKKVYKLIIAESILIISFLYTGCSEKYSTNHEYSLPAEISVKEQEEQSLGSEKNENENPEVSDVAAVKGYSYYIDSGIDFKYEADIYDIDLYEMSELDYAPLLLVRIPKDKEKEESVNRMLLMAYVSKLPLNQQWMEQAEIKIAYRSERYFCFEYVSHAALPDDHDDTQLVFTLDLEEEKLVDYPEIKTECSRYDKFMNGSLYEEMDQWLEKPVEEQNRLRGECGYEVYGETAECNGISFPCVQIEGLENQKRQEQINQLLKAPLSDLILWDGWEEKDEELKVHRFGDAKIYIAYKTEKWLSVVYSIKMEEASKNFGDGIADIGITINMETGERYMLDDFFEVDGLLNWMCANACSGDEKMILDHLWGSIMTEQEITRRRGNQIVSSPLSAYQNTWRSFYISQGKIEILNGWSSFDIEIPLPEVYEYLKIDPWYD